MRVKLVGAIAVLCAAVAFPDDSAATPIPQDPGYACETVAGEHWVPNQYGFYFSVGPHPLWSYTCDAVHDQMIVE